MRKALCVGIDCYEHVDDLHGGVNDANSVKAKTIHPPRIRGLPAQTTASPFPRTAQLPESKDSTQMPPP